jgi:hypothetical protein
MFSKGIDMKNKFKKISKEDILTSEKKLRQPFDTDNIQPEANYFETN